MPVPCKVLEPRANVNLNQALSKFREVSPQRLGVSLKAEWARDTKEYNHVKSNVKDTIMTFLMC